MKWIFSVYNLYNRKNPVYYFYASNKYGDINDNYLEPYKPVSLYQTSYFPLIPSVSYKVYFE